MAVDWSKVRVTEAGFVYPVGPDGTAPTQDELNDLLLVAFLTTPRGDADTQTYLTGDGDD